ncbi:hypothetical protein APY04_1823 [Hyphomicrobium sulfonivorans]|uniref:Uncharacterized protein n=1 Tax=Hyphomicrobium sulfonivorans TaxID=121290 RepID=A0A109BGH3_HYPSL|nr:hypothetical protein APY04_1823 [Hyphomicrobium sulfonivorans]
MVVRAYCPVQPVALDCLAHAAPWDAAVMVVVKWLLFYIRDSEASPSLMGMRHADIHHHD